jgi:secondary thiamine-phosphate synthase enzyme
MSPLDYDPGRSGPGFPATEAAAFAEAGGHMTEVLSVRTTNRKQVVDLTDRIEALIRKAKLAEGLCSLFVTHTTAALTTGEIGEGTEEDFLQVVEQMIPRIAFRHAHNPPHAWSHMASSILGPSLAIPVSGGRLGLGTWQSVMLVELDGPRQRDVHVTLIPS